MMLYCGWSVAHLVRNDYHEKDSEKEFCIATKSLGSFHRSYLIVLLQSDSLFNSGMVRIFHGQSKSYYDAILTLSGMGRAQDLQANRPAAEYKDIVKKVEAEAKKGASSQGKEKRMRDLSASDLHDPAEEAEVNFFVSRLKQKLQKPSSAGLAGLEAKHAFQKKRKGRYRYPQVMPVTLTWMKMTVLWPVLWQFFLRDLN